MHFNPQLKSAGSVCRKAASGCDLPEYCTGVSQDCPEDSFEMNGKPCFDQAQGYCYNGQCPTHQQHCWRLFGRGTQHCCHCGQSSQCTTIPCTQLLCGKLRFFWLDWYKPFQDTNTTAGTIDASVRAQERNYRIEVTRVWSFIVIHWSKPHKNMWNVNFLWYCY